jgi:hypothetical protein
VWEIPVLAVLFILAFGVAIFMVTRTRKPEVTVVTDPNIEKLAVSIAEAVAKKVAQEFIDKLGSVGYHGSKQSPDTPEGQIQIDESIIPIDVVVDVEDMNLEEMAKEEVRKDKGLGASRSKLAKVLKRGPKSDR